MSSRAKEHDYRNTASCDTTFTYFLVTHYNVTNVMVLIGDTHLICYNGLVVGILFCE